MSRLARDGTAEPVLRDQILWRERGQELLIFPVQLTTSRIVNLTRVNPFSAIERCDDHTYIPTTCCAKACVVTHTAALACGVGHAMRLVEKDVQTLEIICNKRKGIVCQIQFESEE